MTAVASPPAGPPDHRRCDPGRPGAPTPASRGVRHEIVDTCASPEYTPLDEVDRAILQLLQRVARNLTAVDIAEMVGVTDGPVRNRLGSL